MRPEEMEGQSTSLFYADEREWGEISDVYTAFQTQNEVKIEALRMARKDGSILVCDVSGVLVDPQKDLSVWTIEDVTERERNKQRFNACPISMLFYPKPTKSLRQPQTNRRCCNHSANWRSAAHT